MPSQEDYLDGLLKGLNGDGEKGREEETAMSETESQEAETGALGSVGESSHEMLSEAMAESEGLSGEALVQAPAETEAGYGAEGASAESFAAEEFVADESMAEDFAAAESAAGDFAAEEPAAGDFAAEESAAGDFAAEESAAGDFAAEESAAGDFAAEEPAAGDFAAEESAAGDFAEEPGYADELVVDGLATEESDTEESAVEEPVIDEPVIEGMPKEAVFAAGEPAIEELTEEETMSEGSVLEESEESEGLSDEALADVLAEAENEYASLEPAFKEAESASGESASETASEENESEENEMDNLAGNAMSEMEELPTNPAPEAEDDGLNIEELEESEGLSGEELADVLAKAESEYAGSESGLDVTGGLEAGALGIESPASDDMAGDFGTENPSGDDMPEMEESKAETAVQEPAADDVEKDDSGIEGLAMDDSAPGLDIASSMTEEDIERLLAEGREEEDSPAFSREETFEGDVKDMLEDTDDSDLKDIKDMLEKSDNNEAVDGEIEALLKGASEDGGSFDELSKNGQSGAEGRESEAGEELDPKKQKALEKKRLKEEKAAAKKAAKEARKAEKAAKKKGKKGKNGAAEESAADSEPQEPIDTSFLDNILSEAGKIASEDGKPADNKEAESQSAPAAQNNPLADAAGVGDLGVDLNNLFGDSSAIESEMTADVSGSDMTEAVEAVEEEGGKPKKKGFFSRFLEFLTEEDEEEEKENENIKLSDENKEILDDLDKEKGNKGKKKDKKGKKKDKKGKDAKGGKEGKESGKKKKKEKKPKKEKTPEEEAARAAEKEATRRALPLKKVLPVVLICLSIGAAIIIITNVTVDYSAKQEAAAAYNNGDYQTCYQNLFGKKLNESEQVMFGKSESILRIRLWIREYEILAAEGEELEALDSLIQSVNAYPALYSEATQWSAAGEVGEGYAVILNYLYERYGLTEEQAKAIAAEPDDIEYTRMVYTIIQGGAFGSWNGSVTAPEAESEEPLPDMLPEEQELPAGTFIENTPVQ